MANSSASASEPTPDERRRAILAAILTISAVGTGLSLMLPLLSLELERMGASSTLNGLNTAVGGLANVLIAPLVPVLARRLGQKLFVATALAVLIGSVLAFRLMPNIPVWFVLRFTFGGAIGALFVISEFWIAASAPEDRRGLIMGIYATVLALGFAAGPAALALVGTVGWRPYLACAGLITAALVPLWLVPGRLPAIDDGAHPKVLLLVKAAPIATLAALVFGALESAAFSQLPVFGLRSGLAETSAALLVTWAALGNLAFQIPIGWLSDRVDRRFVLCGCAGLGGLGCLIMLLIPP
ncbi:MAG: MFS transporter, partial [Proteobacteria bacterium]|nr:MFS transporter [Pseudomonadota bacterium]